MTSFNLTNTPDESHRVPAVARRRDPNANHPDAREPEDTSDLVVKSLDHASIWAKYNAKAGGIQRVVPAKSDDE